MKVLLMTPINRTYVIMPNLGLGYLATCLRKEGHEVTILNCAKEKYTYDDFSDYISKTQFDIVGIQMFTYDLNSVKKHTEIIKKMNPNIIIVAGGYHPSGDPQGTLEYLKDVDYAFVGEAEIGFIKFVNMLVKNEINHLEIPGLVYKENNSIKVNKPEFVEDLDSLDFPAWDIMDPKTFPEAPHGAFVKSFPSAPIIITRGCPFQCTFCSGKSITGNKVRKRSVENVIKEIKFLIKNYGVNEFHIEDENFTLHKDLVKEFCETIIQEKLNLSWCCPAGVRLDTLDKDILKLMERSGCHSLAIGIEFGSQRILNLTKKHLTIEKIKEKVALFKDVDIKTSGFFMMGFPGETKEEILQTIKLSKELDIDRAQFNNFMPLPGSEIYNELKNKGLLKRIDADHFFVHDVAYVPEGLTKQEIKRLQRKAYIGFYLRPKIIWCLLKEIKTPGHLSRLIKRFLDGLR